MIGLPTHCPNCNSLQKFVVHKETDKFMVRRYIYCKMCRTETTISDHTHAVERIKSRRRRSMIAMLRESKGL